MKTTTGYKFVLTILVLWTVHAMNSSEAIAQQPAAGPPTIEGADAFEAREFKAADGGVLPYRLLKPLDDVAKEEDVKDAKQADAKRKYPLVLFLHGAGERGDENVRQLIHGGKAMADQTMRRRHPAFVVAPQCPADKKWVEVPWDASSHSMPDDPGETMQRVFELLASLQKEFPIDDARIYGIGLSMGGYGTWDILQRKPELLAAGVPICGGGDPEHAKALVNTPVWAFHGGADPVVPPQRSRDMIKALVEAGGRPIYTEYEGVGHNSWTETFDNRLMWDWLFAQRRK
jgi:predicted peptidase